MCGVMQIRKFSSMVIAGVLVGIAQAEYDDPVAVLAAEDDSATLAEGENIVHEDDTETEESLASRYLMAQLSIVQGLTERLTSDLVAAVPEEVAENLQEVLAEARALENLAINVQAGEFDEAMENLEATADVEALYEDLEDAIDKLEVKAYYNCPELEDVVGQILNIISDL